MNLTNEKLVKRPSKYYTQPLDIANWGVVEKEWQKLLELPIGSAQELMSFIERYSELASLLYDEGTWRYIKMTCNADKEEFTKAFSDYYANISCNSEAYDFKVKKKYYDNPFRSELPKERYAQFDKNVSNDIELFREENTPLKVKEQELYSKYGTIMSQLTVMYKGEEKTLTQMGVYQKDKDRAVREEAWRLVNGKLAEVADELDQLFDDLKALRIQMAKNAGFDNYRDYMHQAKGRFAYTPEDLYRFHEAVEKAIIPFLKEQSVERKEKLDVDTLRPWDTQVELDGKALKPFATIEEFVDKGVEVLGKVKPEFGVTFNMMKNTGLLDLDNRKGKAPGGYCATVNEYGSSFIFMNAVGLHSDLTTLVHEAGHAMHAKAIADETIFQYKFTPEEVSELASMSMEFLTMNYWDAYYSNPEDLQKAKRDQMLGALKFMPWCMIVDAYQHWIYTNPEHTAAERANYFASLVERFNTGVCWDGLEKERMIGWMRQLHIFEVPFYYIEYGIAQLGALAVYMNYKVNPAKAVEGYQNFMKLGYSRPANELYETAGVQFNFTEGYIKEIVDFVKAELAGLK